MSTGQFVWHQLNTTDPAAAKQFYGDLLGWSYEDADMEDMTYTMFGLSGENFGGIMQLMAPEGTPSHWIPYIAVDDVDASAKQVKQLGGQLYFGPDDIPNVGRFALVADPQGAAFQLFKPSGGGEMPESSAQTPAGAVAWEELLTSDPDAGLAFYGKIFGWTSEKMPMGDMDYYLIKRDGKNVGGAMQRPDTMPVSAWNVYFEVAGVDAAYAKVTELGGTTYTGIMPVPGTGRLAAVADPTGAMFSIIQQEEMAG